MPPFTGKLQNDSWNRKTCIRILKASAKSAEAFFRAVLSCCGSQVRSGIRSGKSQPCSEFQEREAFLKFGAELSLCGPLTGHSARFLYHSGSSPSAHIYGSDSLPAHSHMRILLFHCLTHSLHCQKIRSEPLLCLIHEQDLNVPRLSLLSKHIIERIQIIAVVIRQRKVFCKASVKLFSVPYPSDIYFEFHIPHTFRSDSDRTTFLPDSSGPSLYGYRFTAFTKNRRGCKHPTPPHIKVQKTRSDRLCSRSVRPMNK